MGESSKGKHSKTKSYYCPICGERFGEFSELIDHIRKESYGDKAHEVLLTAYYTMVTHINAAINRLFASFSQKIREIEMEAKSLKKPSEKKIGDIILKIQQEIEKIPEPEDPIEMALYESVVSNIQAILNWRRKTKRDLLRILSAIRAIFVEGRKAYISMLLKAAMILSNKYFIRV